MKTISFKTSAAVLTVTAALLGASESARAGAYDTVFTGSSGALSASAEFHQIGANLVITLVNTSAADVNDAGQVLTAIFFNIDPTAGLTKGSVVLGSGSTVLYGGTTDPGGVVGGEWAFKEGGLSGAPGNAVLGVSSSGLNWFGPHDLFPGSNLAGPDSPDGVEYGITSAGDNPSTSNGSIGPSNPVIKNSVVITLGLPTGYTLGNISDVTFQYGTGMNEPSFPGTPVPEPTTMIAGALLLLPFGASTLRVLRNRKA